MALVDTKKMFKMAYDNGYAIGAFNVNNMEITQGIMGAIGEEKAPLILQISRGARKYASMSYLRAIIDVAVAENPDILNDPAAWTKIYEANKDVIGEDPSLVYPYTVLVIPEN